MEQRGENVMTTPLLSRRVRDKLKMMTKHYPRRWQWARVRKPLLTVVVPNTPDITISGKSALLINFPARMS